jgi:hypothetical protein
VSATVRNLRGDLARRDPGTGGERARRPPVNPSVHTPAARVLALQRAIGNIATRRLLRQAAQSDFRVVIVPDGEVGVSQAAVTRALTVVRQELRSVTGSSRDPTVRRGVAVEYRQSDGDLTGLHQRVFLCYLMQGRDADRAVRLARPHLPRGYDEDLRSAAHELNSIGGANLRIDFNGRSPSVSLVSTGALADLVRGREGGERLAGQLLGEIVLHELGHALRARHASAGIMEGRAVFDAATLGRPRHFSTDSANEIRTRLEYLAAH